MNVTKDDADEGAMSMAINIDTANFLSIFTRCFGDAIYYLCVSKVQKFIY